MLFVIQAAWCDESGMLHPDHSRLLVHQVRERLCTAGDRDRGGIGGVVARLHHHADGKVIERDLLPFFEVHGAALGDHFIGEFHHAIIDRGFFERQQGRHDLGGRRDRELLIGVLRHEDLSVIRTVQHICRGGNGKLFRVNGKGRKNADQP